MKFYKKQAAAGDLPILETPAGAANIEEGKQAISASGSVITGELSPMVSVSKVASSVKVSGSNIEMSTKYTAKHIFDTNTNITLTKALSNFGDATAADVAAGKTFTSSAGLKVTGTKESGAALPTLTNPADASDISSGKQAIDGSGNLITGTGTMLAAEDYDITNAERFSDTQNATNTGTLTINFSNYHRVVIATLYFMTSETAYYKANLLLIDDICMLVNGTRGSNASFTTEYDAIFDTQIFKVTRSGNSITFSLDKVSINMKYYNKSLTSKTVTITKMGNSNMNYVVYGV